MNDFQYVIDKATDEGVDFDPLEYALLWAVIQDQAKTFDAVVQSINSFGLAVSADFLSETIYRLKEQGWLKNQEELQIL